MFKIDDIINFSKQSNKPVKFSKKDVINPKRNVKPKINGTFLSCREYQKDIMKLVYRIPSEVDTIIGISRSGIYPASMVAMMTHLPLLIFRQSKKDIIEAGNGYRLKSDKDGVIHDLPGKNPIVIDDTVMTGNSFAMCRKLLEKDHPNIIFASVYCNPGANVKPDLWVRDLNHPHFLEWNLFNSIFSHNIATDFDGVLCQDCEIAQDDDGPRYLDFIRNAKPKNLMRKVQVPLIVTARLEKYRKETINWLKRYNIKFNKLIMHPAETLAERNRDDISAFKAKHIIEWANKIENRHSWKFPIFVESNDYQARQIAKITNILTICTDTYQCYNESEEGY